MLWCSADQDHEETVRLVIRVPRCQYRELRAFSQFESTLTMQPAKQLDHGSESDRAAETAKNSMRYVRRAAVSVLFAAERGYWRM
ncbi:hypothetical protein LAD77_00885 [Klebsiella pneumoniae]|nr:hypothetical protein [Klebsiella pneumoniae]